MKTNVHWKILLSVLMGCALGPTAIAQVAPAGSNQTTGDTEELSEVVVTAQKVTQSLQHTPVAVVAIDGSSLTAQGVTDMRGVDDMIPSAQFQEERGATKVFLRGVGTYLDVDSTDPATATNIDEIYTPREATGGSLYDVKQVEVLYGPQGTLYGRNAAGGAVNIMTNDPSHEVGGDASLEGGNYDLVHATGVLNVPLGSVLAVRGAVDYQYHNGYLSDGMDDQKSVGARLKALFTPTDAVRILVTGEYYHDGGNGDSPKPITPSPSFPSSMSPWTFDIDPRIADWFRDFDVKKIYGKAEFDLNENVTLVYVPAYLSYDDNSNLFNGPGSIQIHPKGDQNTQELRLQGRSQAVDWVAGLYWYKFDGTTYSNLTLSPIPIPYPSASMLFNVDSKSYAAFGQMTYKATDVLSLIAGVRYSNDKRSGDGTNYFNLAPTLSFPAPFAASGLSSSNVAFRAGVQADLTAQNMVYFTASSGYNEGGFSPLASGVTGGALTFEPMKLWAYQLGSKNRFFDNRLEINDELYYYDLKNDQVSAFNQALGGLVVVNAAKAQMYGNDVTIRFNATENDHISLVMGLERTRAIDFQIPVSLAGPGNACDCDGFSLPNAPALTEAVEYSHTFQLSGGATLVGDVESYFSGSYWNVYNHPGQTASPAFTKSNLSFTYHAPENRWYLSAWIRNMENSDHYGSVSSPASQLTPTTGFIDPPRTYGGTVGVHF